MKNAPTPENLRNVQTLGIVSDTHGHIRNTQQGVRMLESLEVDAVVHCGDIGSPDIPPLFRAWPTHYVLGNVDWPRQDLLESIEAAGGTLHGRFGAIVAAGRKIAFLHGDDATRFNVEIESGHWDLICHGHTHKANQDTQGKTLILNPGALQRAWPPSIAVVELSPLRATMIPLQ